jgi:hypothetical protein
MDLIVAPFPTRNLQSVLLFHVSSALPGVSDMTLSQI